MILNNLNIKYLSYFFSFWVLAIFGRAEETNKPPITLQTVEVIWITPTAGTEIEKDRFPANVQILSNELLDEIQVLSLNDMLNKQIGSVTTSNAQGNPFQPDLSYRGLTVSPLVGLPQGLSIYQNGIRINESFGDTVHFDLVPEFAIESVQIVPGSNPLYGLNTLGAAIALDLKDGFSYQGAEAEIFGGSFERIQETFQYGIKDDKFAFYLGETYFEEDGWRDESQSDLFQLFSDLAFKTELLELGVSFLYAKSDLNGNGAAPIELIEVDRTAVFTFPDNTQNELSSLTFRSNYKPSDWLSLQGNGYFLHLDRSTLNGDETDIDVCEDNEGLLCEEEGEGGPVEDLKGELITADLVGEKPFGVFNRSETQTNSYGGSLQAIIEAELFSFESQLIIGGSVDIGQTDFMNDTEIGELTENRTINGRGNFIAGDEFNTDIYTRNEAVGIYFASMMALTSKLDLLISGRFNAINIKIEDNFGDDLNGDHEFNRFNFAIGLTHNWRENFTTYVNYSESNRAPTAAELSCADPSQPCRFPNAFIADPPLNQVVARTFEGGARGRITSSENSLNVNWSVAGFWMENSDDIIFISSGPVTGSGFFQNVGETKRVGVELGLYGSFDKLNWFANYAWIDGTIEVPLTLLSENNPSANSNGEIKVDPSDQIPGIPEHSLKLGVSYDLTKKWTLALESIFASSRFYRGDEGNDVAPVDDYAVFNLRSNYRISEKIEAFVLVDNLFNTEYETFGTFGDTGDVELSEVPGGGTDPRFLGAGSPRGVWVGLQIKL